MTMLKAPGLLSGTPGYNANNVQAFIHILFGNNPAFMFALTNGAGVSIGDFDDGIDKTNAALVPAYNASLEDGNPADYLTAEPGGEADGFHGTATAGLMVADSAADGGQVTGLAYGATLTAINVFNSTLNLNTAAPDYAKFDVDNLSIGIDRWYEDFSEDEADGLTAAFLADEGFTTAAETGRGGLGTAVVLAAGNYYISQTPADYLFADVNENAFTNQRDVIVVGAADSETINANGVYTVDTYSDRGANLLVLAPGDNLTTTALTINGGYTTTFSGTSGATPIVSAIVADMQSINPNLGLRDIMAILAYTADDSETAGRFTTAATGQMSSGWTLNGADNWNGGGLHYSNSDGFGLVNAHAAIEEAQAYEWFETTPLTSSNELSAAADSSSTLNTTGDNGVSTTIKLSTSVDIETVTLTLDLQSSDIDSSWIKIISPDGTQSNVHTPSIGNDPINGLWTFTSEAFRGENSTGTWTVAIAGGINNHSNLAISASAISLTAYGSNEPVAVSSASATSQDQPQTVWHYTNEAAEMVAYQPARELLTDPNGGVDWIDLAPISESVYLDLYQGGVSTMNGQAFLKIATGTIINKAIAGSGTTTIQANMHGDELVGGYGLDDLIGNVGNDTLVAGYGGGTMHGAGGNNTFEFTHASIGVQSIADFNANDQIDISKSIFETYTAMMSAATQTGANTVISIDSHDQIILDNMKKTSLVASEVVFI